MRKRGIIAAFVFAFLFLALPFSLAASVTNNLPVQIQSTNNNGDIVTGTFNYTVNISNSASNTCDSSNIVYSNETTKTTDNRGIVSYQLKDVDLGFDEQYWFCYYRDGNLEDTVKMGSTPYAFSAEGLRASEGLIQNVSDINGSDITNDLNWTNNSDLSGSTFWNRSSGNVYPDNLSDNVGIGTDSPGVWDLDVHGRQEILYSNSDSYSSEDFDIPSFKLNNEKDSGSTYSSLRFSPTGANNGAVASISAIDVPSSSRNAAFTIKTRNDTRIFERFRVGPQGNVGIGTTSPSSKLDVDGQINATDDVCVDGSGCLNDVKVGTDKFWNRSSSGYIYPANLSDLVNATSGVSVPESSSYKFSEVGFLRADLNTRSLALGDTNADISNNDIIAIGNGSAENLVGGVTPPDSIVAIGKDSADSGSGQILAAGEEAGSGATQSYSALGYQSGKNANSFFAAVGREAGKDANDEFVALGESAGKDANDRFTAIGFRSTDTTTLSTPTSISDSVAIGYESAPQYDGNFLIQQANLGDGSPILQGDMDTDKLGVDFSNNATLSDTFNVNGTANITGNVTSQTDFCIEGGKCLSGVAVEDTNLSGISPSSNSLSNSFPDISVNWNDATDLTTNGDLGSSTVSDSELSVNVEGISTGLSSGSIVFSDGSTLSGENSNLYWDSSNDRLGIGTSSPSSNLDVDGSAQFGGTWENGGAEIQDGDVYAQTGYFYNISSLNVSTLSVNGSQIPQLDDTFVLGNSTNRWKSANVGTGGINSTGTIRQEGNQVLDTSDQKWNLSSGNVYLDDSSDNVGIGTSSPTEKFDVHGNTRIRSTSGNAFRVDDGSGQETFKVNTDVSGGQSILRVNSPGGSGIIMDIFDRGDRVGAFNYGFGSNNFRFETTESAGGNRVSALKLPSESSNAGNAYFPNGDVGIGTTSPSSKLEVDGDINASGDINNSGQVSLAEGAIQTSEQEITVKL